MANAGRAKNRAVTPALPRGRNALPDGDRRAIQRLRLLRAVVDLSFSRPVHEVTVADIISRARVSRRTFYELFEDRESCFVAACGKMAECLDQHLNNDSLNGIDDDSYLAVARLLLRLAGKHSRQTYCLTVRALGAGPDACCARSRAVELVEQALWTVGKKVPPDIAKFLVGGLARVVVTARAGLDSSRHDLWTYNFSRWLLRYELPGRNLPEPNLGNYPSDRNTPHSVVRNDRDARSQRKHVVAQRDREAVLRSVTLLAARKGYANMTVQDILTLSRVRRSAFDDEFGDKRQAFDAAFRRARRQAMTATAQGCAKAGTWPERIYECLAQLASYFSQRQEIAHLCLVEAYVTGDDPHVGDILLVFAALLEEGYAPEQGYDPPPRITTMLVCETVTELLQSYTHAGRASELVTAVPQLAYIALAPFIGSSAAVDVIMAMSLS
jgi:AcrR family transcriptional regulator